MTIESASAPQANYDESVGTRVHMFMWQQKVSQVAMGQLLGVNQAGVARRLRGQTSWSVGELITIAGRFETSVAYLIGETDDPKCARWGSNPRPADYKSAGSKPNRRTFRDRKLGRKSPAGDLVPIDWARSTRIPVLS